MTLLTDGNTTPVCPTKINEQDIQKDTSKDLDESVNKNNPLNSNSNSDIISSKRKKIIKETYKKKITGAKSLGNKINDNENNKKVSYEKD